MRKVVRREEVKAPAPAVIRKRIVFPGAGNFEGWWALSPKGRIAQLQKDSVNRRGMTVYRLIHAALPDYPQTVGAGLFTMEALLNYGISIHATKEEARSSTPRKYLAYELKMLELDRVMTMKAGGEAAKKVASAPREVAPQPRTSRRVIRRVTC